MEEVSPTILELVARTSGDPPCSALCLSRTRMPKDVDWMTWHDDDCPRNPRQKGVIMNVFWSTHEGYVLRDILERHVKLLELDIELAEAKLTALKEELRVAEDLLKDASSEDD